MKERKRHTSEEQRCRATVGQALPAAEPKTHANRGADANHGEMATVELSMQGAVGTLIELNTGHLDGPSLAVRLGLFGICLKLHCQTKPIPNADISLVSEMGGKAK